MERRPWLDRMAEALAGESLPASARARLLAELRDHLEDLKEGESHMTTDVRIAERMGDPATLAASASAEFRRASWMRRHPLLVFGVGPLPAVVLALAGYALAVGLLGYGLGAAGFDEKTPPLALLATVVLHGLAYVPFALAAAWLGWAGARSGVRPGWRALALAQVALLAGLAVVDLTFSDLPGQSRIALGLAIPYAGWRQVIQLLIPLAIGGMAARVGRPDVALA